jgi:hypothetical protein
MRRDPSFTPLNLKFENLNATTSKKEYAIRDISGILYDKKNKNKNKIK